MRIKCNEMRTTSLRSDTGITRKRIDCRKKKTTSTNARNTRCALLAGWLAISWLVLSSRHCWEKRVNCSGSVSSHWEGSNRVRRVSCLSVPRTLLLLLLLRRLLLHAATSSSLSLLSFCPSFLPPLPAIRAPAHKLTTTHSSFTNDKNSSSLDSSTKLTRACFSSTFSVHKFLYN